MRGERKLSCVARKGSVAWLEEAQLRGKKRGGPVAWGEEAYSSDCLGHHTKQYEQPWPVTLACIPYTQYCIELCTYPQLNVYYMLQRHNLTYASQSNILKLFSMTLPIPNVVLSSARVVGNKSVWNIKRKPSLTTLQQLHGTLRPFYL